MTKRTRRYGTAVVEQVDIGILAVRDGWQCHHCFDEVTRATWSMDHLVPLSEGGDHTYANTALAHRRCNDARNRER